MTQRTAIPSVRKLAFAVLLGLALGAGSGCFKAQTVLENHEADGGDAERDGGPTQNNGGGAAHGGHAGGDGGDPVFGNGDGDGDGGMASVPVDSPAHAICDGHSQCKVLGQNVDKLDLLFAIDNSNSMKEEQERLRMQFGRLITMLTSGERGDGTRFTPIRDLHLGVVSSDMGLSGIPDVKDCGDIDPLGDDGILQHAPTTDPTVQGCQASYPPFLSFRTNDPGGDLGATAVDLQCIASLGTAGCGFEQQLEAPLKALWPSNDPMPTADGSNRIKFVQRPDGTGELGHGDEENAGFLRDPYSNPSLIAVVLFTDEEDCSSARNDHFKPSKFLDPNSPLATQPLNLRCYYAGMDNSDNSELYPISRYVAGLRALRPDNPDQVIFQAIAGVPPELVTRDAVARFDLSDAAQRDAFYQGILDAPAMQARPDPASMTTPENGNLMPSCNTFDSEGKPTGKAYPPRRIVQVAQGFGQNGIVSSICDDDYSSAIDALVDRVAARSGTPCLERRVARNDSGLVAGCKVFWQLPVEGTEVAGTPTDCKDLPGFLTRASAEAAAAGIPASSLCKVTQLPVLESAVEPEPAKMGMSGWYYDDFSADAVGCASGAGRINFMQGGNATTVPPGVRAILDCN